MRLHRGISHGSVFLSKNPGLEGVYGFIADLEFSTGPNTQPASRYVSVPDEEKPVSKLVKHHGVSVNNYK
jgi:hypothetical protein